MSFLKQVKTRVLGGAVNDLAIQDAGVGDELAAAGKAFGTLMEQVGLAVAETQKQLDKNGADITELMCETEVEMIRARETLYGEDGKITGIKIVTGKGRLIELASPVFYEHKFVALQGEFTAKELATSTQSKVSQAGVTASGSIGKKKQKGTKTSLTGSASASASASFSDVTAGSTFDSSIGTMRMNALIAPKDSIGIPKPPLILEGPKITIVAGATTTRSDGTRTTPVIITVKKRNGDLNFGRLLAIDADGVDWTIPSSHTPYEQVKTTPPADPVVVAGGPQTNNVGELKIDLTRTQTPGAPPLESKKAAVTVRLGLVTATATVTV